ncbi:G-type lectin S-receptor-like serine/threonine-protein kinase At4g27290 isoform X2 [Herrania umbratica]|uniref:Receptor-like serine/threonine-protein kinase n=1 Tax=Herrania umbratica TaxID=108875 RepID=A0A6J1BJZ9_9ROSI|nr:G-type lectin S-receptor-like serine/threonine-protein kinase At4g27290 isoform X2 [Herrania umbratica]
MVGLKVFLLVFSLFSFAIISLAVDSIGANQSIKDGETIASADGDFELGFFSPGSSGNRYVGIWYKKISSGTVVWVANRNTPLSDTQGQLLFADQGNLVLVNSTNGIVWSTNSSSTTANPVAQLLDTGNLVVRDGSDDNLGNFLWQSFDYPTDTFLPGMKYGINLVTGLNRYLTSWKGIDDPSSGNYTNGLDPDGLPQFFLREDSELLFRTGHWNGLRFTGMPNLKPNPIYTFEFVFNDEEIYYEYELIDKSVVSRMVLGPDGALQRFTWVDRTQGWRLYLNAMMDNCDRYALCGAHGSCNINNSPACGCLKGFVPKYPNDWGAADWTHGCVRKVRFNCGEGEDFLEYSGIKLPDSRHAWYNRTMDLKECKKQCLENCSCTAFANLDIRDGGSGCILWFGDLIDMREFEENGEIIYIRMAASEIEASRLSKRKKNLKIIIVTVLSVGFAILGFCLILLVLRKKKKKLKMKGSIQHDPGEEKNKERGKEDLELPLFDFDTISKATDNFSQQNKLGQGGFGPVYKGILEKGQEIAVKRLSKKSSQGIDEFKNEVLCISKLQHRNLVKLLGCCIERQEIILIYEFMPNKSLDSFIFDQKQSILLDWPKRFQIINGISRGLLYLHQDSRLRIIHRDLKASNILLDYEMNPKISDFGLARSFGGDETEANTNRVVGTYGYMSPEYAIDGCFSIKSDVFSFGVLVLEIVSGRRNRGFSHPGHNLNLLGHAFGIAR